MLNKVFSRNGVVGIQAAQCSGSHVPGLVVQSIPWHIRAMQALCRDELVSLRLSILSLLNTDLAQT